MTKQEIKSLNRLVSKLAKATFQRVENLTVSQWAQKHRRLSSEASAEAGPWRNSRTPYLVEPMDALTDPRVRNVVMVAASQVGKSECLANFIGYIIDQDPSSILFVHPTLDDARKFSRLRIAPMIRDCPTIRRKVKDVKQGRGATSNTILQKAFPGGILTMTGSNAPSALASMPIRYILGDERDRWAASAGTEGDPWELAKARQTTFYNAKSIEVSTPTILGASNIASAYERGTQERWCHQCPDCGEFAEIRFDDIHFKPLQIKEGGKIAWKLDGPVEWTCPNCGCLTPEDVMRKQPQKWVATKPSAYETAKTRSFWLNAFSSPWVPWSRIVLSFLDAKNDPERLQVVYNTLFGQLWENRGEMASEDDLMARREDYGTRDNNSPVQVPDDVLVLTCGVDNQNDRLEYEVVGHGMYGETWGIEYGMIMGRPDDPDVWDRLDHIISQPYFMRDGRSLKVSLTCVDSGGAYTDDVYRACKQRQRQRVFAIKGKGGDSVPFVSPPSKIKLKDGRSTVWLYTIGVDSGKQKIMDSTEVQQPGPNYCHFPVNPDAGYDYRYFNGLLSEHMVQNKGGLNRWRWEKLPGHQRNEPLDCRNYALAALRILNPPLQRLKQDRLGSAQPKAIRRRKKPKKQNLFDL